MHMEQEPTFRWDRGLEEPARTIAALDHTPIRVLAGPGTGKTYAMMRRVARLLQEGSNPDRILVCTFTRTAAGDLSRELSNLGVDGVDEVRAGTLHSFCFRLLRQSEVFEITGRVARPLLQFEERFLLEDLDHKSFGGIRERKRRLRAFNAAWARLQHEEPGWPTDSMDQTFQQDLKEWLQFHESILIGELVPETLRFLRQNPLSPHREVFDYVLIDEYQDLNKAEQTLLDLLAERGQIFVIGDEDQSIYSFKFAHPEGIANFGRSHPGTHDFGLDECYRCPKSVVELANKLIANNEREQSRSLTPRPYNPDGKVHILQWNSIDEEAQGIAKIIQSQVERQEVKPGQILVLAPRRQIGYAIRSALNSTGVSAHSFFLEEELDTDNAQQAFTLLTLLVNPEDRVALRCWCGFGSPSRRKGAWKRLWNYCNRNVETPQMVLEQLTSGKINISRTNQLVVRFKKLQEHFIELGNHRGQALLDAIFPENEDWTNSLRTLASTIQGDDFNAEELHGHLNIQITQSELPTDGDFVRVMSLHKSKGLTAELVVVVGCIQGLIPTQPRSGSTLSEQKTFLEEQRRLFYVAITRCKKSLILSSVTKLPRQLAHQMRAQVPNSNRRYVHTITSNFIGELGPSQPTHKRGAEFLAEIES